MPVDDRAVLAAILQAAIAKRRKVFVSYHHQGDQYYYDAFSLMFHDQFETVFDNSVDRLIDSDASEYIMRRIREEFISGTSCTIVLCGAETPWRKYVDWEIKATLDKQHGLVGINLPTNPVMPNSRYRVPERLHDNIESGYATWESWENLFSGGSARLISLIETASSRAKSLIKNQGPMRQRNGVPPWRS